MSANHLSGQMKAKARPKEGNGDNLIPGMLDRITLAQIVPKLPWKAFYVLSSVSLAWRRAIRSRQVYNARVDSKSLETLVLLNCGVFYGLNAIVLYSVRDNVYHRLPPFLTVLGVPSYAKCKCIAVDGKLYLLGGVYTNTTLSCTVYLANSVYVLDLAGQRQWRECARMAHEREEFACGAMEGKIFVFQGSNSYKPACWCEVYDPKINAWSLLSFRHPMPPLRFGHKVATVGEEFFLHGGRVFDPEYLGYLADQQGEEDSDEDSDECLDDYDENFIRFPDAVEVYNPIRDDWRAVKPLQRRSGALFTAHGKLYSMDDLGIDIYDTETNSWANLHSHSFAAIELAPLASIELAFGGIGVVDSLSPLAVLVVDGELLAIVDRMRGNVRVGEKHLIRSKGLGGENKEIVWQKVQCSPPYPGWLALSNTVDMSPIQL